MSMQLDGVRNDGYPYDADSILLPDGMTAPYPAMLWQTDAAYPVISLALPIPSGMTAPYPAMLWRLDGYNNDGYPCIGTMRIPLPTISLPNIYDRMRVYDRMTTDFDTNGIAILSPETCEISEELNGGYELTMEHPQDPDGVWRNLIEFRVVKAQGQLFRIYSKETDAVSRKVNARHIFYDLNSYFIKSAHPTNLTGQLALEWILRHTYTDPPPFTARSDITDVRTAYYDKMSPTCAILGADNSFISVWGGELLRDNFNIYINKKRGTTNAFSLRYGCNLTAITEAVDCSDYCPRIYWEAKVGGVENALRGIASYAQLALPIQPMQYISITVDEQITETAAVMDDINRQVKEYVAGHCMPLVNYRVDIVDIRRMPEYADFVGLAAYDVGDVGTIYSDTLGISTQQQIIKQTRNGITGDVISVELGNARKSIVARSGHIVGTYQFEDAQREAAAENTWDNLGLMGYTWDMVQNISWDEASGEVAIKYE